jgi:hypothetical protein
VLRTTPAKVRGIAMISVVEWFAPIRNAAWVAACFGSLGE